MNRYKLHYIRRPRPIAVGDKIRHTNAWLIKVVRLHDPDFSERRGIAVAVYEHALSGKRVDVEWISPPGKAKVTDYNLSADDFTNE